MIAAGTNVVGTRISEIQGIVETLSESIQDSLL